jgi:hypothetical protein
MQLCICNTEKLSLEPSELELHHITAPTLSNDAAPSGSDSVKLFLNMNYLILNVYLQGKN